MLLEMILTNISVFNCSTFKYYRITQENFHEQPRIGWPEWHGWSRIFWCPSINIVCNHIPKILQWCDCLGVLYTCMTWICNYIPNNTGKEGVFIFRCRPGRTPCNEEVTCSWLSEAFVTQIVCLSGAIWWRRHSEALIIALCVNV